MPVTCKICLKDFSTQSSVNRHLKNYHNRDEKNIVSYDFDSFNSKCLEEGCNTSYRFTAELRYHLETIHNKNMEKEIIYFSGIEEFESWLNELCKNNNLQYVRHQQEEGGTTYLNCNRSGIYATKTENRKRAMKSQGSCKIGSKCTSQILLNHTTNIGYCATYYKTHYGHNIQVQHVRIFKQSRVDVAAQLTSGISVTRILDTCRNSFVEGKLSRSDLITRKDVNNIKSSYHINIQDGVRHEIDSISVDLLIEQCNEVGDEILLYKKQGQEFPRLNTDDFCLIIMNKAQEDMLKKFGSSVIAIDSTHGLNMYDFELTTVMVIDEFGEGFPAAFMFSNRKDTLIHEIFFNYVKMKCGIIHPKVFMSDITSIYCNAWLSVMKSEVLNRLYCSWHIDRAWRCNLNKIGKTDKKKQVYQMLKVLQNTLDVADFERKLASVEKSLLGDSETTIFGKYFRENYISNCKMWAYCYRKNCGINTNMVVV